MTNWILYDDFVELVRNHHLNAFSGLITGVSDSNHSFQIGFDHGDIVLLSYRITKGNAALSMITQIVRAKITEHPGRNLQNTCSDVLDTGSLLSQLTAATLNETTNITIDINDVSARP